MLYILKRKLYDKLLEWKQSHSRTAILIEGVRRVGKTTLVEEFAKHEYKHCLIINWTFAEPQVKELFNNSLENLDDLFNFLQIYYRVNLVPHETLIVLMRFKPFPVLEKLSKCLLQMAAMTI